MATDHVTCTPYRSCDLFVVISYLDHNTTLVVTNGNIIGASHLADEPHSFQTVVESGLQSVCVGMPNTDRSLERVGVGVTISKKLSV